MWGGPLGGSTGSRPTQGGKTLPPPHGSRHLSHLRGRPHLSLAQLCLPSATSREVPVLPTTQGPPAPGPFQTHTFQIQAVDAVPEVRELLGKQSGRWSSQEALDQAVRLSVPNSGAARALKQAILEHSGMTHPEGRH